MKRLFMVVALVAAGGCSDTILSQCGSDAVCINGRCLPLPDRPTVLYCAFYDKSCPSWLRWSTEAPGPDANACYEPTADGGLFVDMSMPVDMPFIVD